MHVIATAGHVDHGKSTLVRALTGMEPDRWAEERKRGMTIDLGYAWMTTASGSQLAFVDVPGHQRFIGNMLAGLGPAPAVLFVVAADEGWSRQSEEHLAAAHALRLRSGVLAVTRSDLGDPGPALAEARGRIARSSLGELPAVAVSGVTHAGLDDLCRALDDLVAELPAPDPSARVRLWIDRSFTVRGAGTVVTGTLDAGQVRVGDEFELHDRRVTIRAVQSLGTPRHGVEAVARVALNLRGVAAAEVRRGDVLLSPGAWLHTRSFDVRLETAAGARLDQLPAELVLHVGTACLPTHLRPLGDDIVRLSVRTPLPLQIGDRGLLRDPGRQTIAAGVQVLDPDPPDLRRRGAAAERAAQLRTADGSPDAAAEIARRHAVRTEHLRALGVPVFLSPPTSRAAQTRNSAAGSTSPPPASGRSPAVASPPPAGDASAPAWTTRPRPSDRSLARTGPSRQANAPSTLSTTLLPHLSALEVAGWLVSQPIWAQWARRLTNELDRWSADHPLETGMPVATLNRALDLPDPDLAIALARQEGLAYAGGRIQRPQRKASLGPADAAVAELERRLSADPFAAPSRDDLADLHLGRRELAAAEKMGRLLRIADDVVLLPSAPGLAVDTLRTLQEPFTVSEARQLLGTSRRVAVPLMEYLDAHGFTERCAEQRRRLRAADSAHPGSVTRG